jgi:hypothetical protein
LVLASCNKDKEILNTLNDYNINQQNKGYHFGDKLKLPQDVLDYAEAVTITYNDKETSNLTIDPNIFSLGENDVTFNIKTKGGEVLTQDATINVFAKVKPERSHTKLSINIHMILRILSRVFNWMEIQFMNPMDNMVNPES